MLHQVPDSAQRARLLDVVQLQTQLIEALCALAEGSVADLVWLQRVWSKVRRDWVQRFWELPQDTSLPTKPGKRSAWIKTIAAATLADKTTIRHLMEEQLRFSELYATPATVRLTDHDWTPPVFAATKRLLVSFYAPLFYKDEGFPNADGTHFHKEHFISPRPRICPYTDNVIQDPKLDHFLPKDQFPILACHPDNLIPCSTDANSGSHKGTKVPLVLNDSDQAAGWFHPRWRSARGTYNLTFNSEPSASQPRVQFVGVNDNDQTRLDNLEGMFGLSEFWGRSLDDEVQSVAGDVQGWLSDDGTPPSEVNVRDYVLRRSRQERKRIGTDALAIVKSYFYEHIAQTPVLLAQVVRTCKSGT
jgi:hypothetical protein